MKNLIFKSVFFVSILSLTSCSTQKTVKLGNDTYVTEYKYSRIIKKAHRDAMREMSKEDKKILKGVNIKFHTSQE
jgi:hypothetical protein